MRLHTLRFRSRAALITLALGAALARTAGAQGAGTITGRVTDASSGSPIDQVHINVVGTRFGGVTNADGRYTIRNVPPGTVAVRALRVGYAEQKKNATVGDAPASVDFALASVAVSLTPVVTTATGETRRVELGNSIANIQAAEVVQTSTIRNLDDLINSRTAGVSVTTGVQTGTGSRVRIRGQSSLNLSNDPIYIIDGIRMTSDIGSITYGTSGANPSRVSDLNPEEIENIEIVKGPSAATLYGTDAANGVVVITTKRGRAGPARWNTYAEAGRLEDRNPYPYNYTIWGRLAATPTAAGQACTLPQVSAGTCLQDSVRIYAPLHDPDATPLGPGNRYQAGVQLMAGNDLINYFISAEREEETGTMRLPAFEARRMDSAGVPIREWTRRPNELGRNSFRANANLRVGPKLDIGAQSAFININQRFSIESNGTAGIGSHVFGGPGYKDNCTVAVTPATPCNGYRAWTPGYTWQERRSQNINRFLFSLDGNWRPIAWNETRMSVGNDYTDRGDDDLRFRGEAPPLNATYRLGFAGEARTAVRTTTLNASSTGTFNPAASINSKTTIGVNYVNYLFDQARAEGLELPPGSQTPGSGAVPSSPSAATLRKTLGLFIEEAVALNDRLYLTAALRSDQNSAFGTDFQSVIYPKASVSWIVSDESFFPRPNWLGQFRLRTAYGASGVQPGSNDAIRSFEAVTANVGGVDLPAVRNDLLGNKDLRPEKSTELEAGFEMSMLQDRVTVDLTGYQKKTRDALIAAVVAPSAGSQSTTVRRNLGEIRNQGLELLTSAQLVNRERFLWDVTVNASTNSNKLLSLGDTPEQVNVNTRVAEGYPLFGWWAAPITGWEDRNADGILTYNADPALNEVFVSDVPVFRGYTQPRHLLTIANGFEFLSNRLRLQGVMDYRGGHRAYNNTERIRCASRQNCNGLMNPEASFEEQAMVVAHLNHPTRTLDGFYQPGAFWKLREVSLRYSIPPRLLGYARGARTGDIVLSGRNLKTWTKYRGVDPENDFTATDGGDVPSDFQTLGPATYYTIRFSLGF
jgi:TonB-linked SusC/RagA family outer membrane protein